MIGLQIERLSLTPDAAHQILSRALGQIGYWATVEQCHFAEPGILDRLRPGVRPAQIAYLRLRDIPSGCPVLHVGREELEAALDRLLAGVVPLDPAILGRIIYGRLDGPAADVLVQVAVFGRVVYA